MFMTKLRIAVALALVATAAGGSDWGQVQMSNTSVVGFTGDYDKSPTKFFERHLHAASRSHLYQPIGVLPPDEGGGTGPLGGYDSLDRLRQYPRGTLASGGGAVSTPISLPNTDELRQFFGRDEARLGALVDKRL